MKLLIIDCTRDPISWGGEEFRAILSKIPNLEVHVRRAPEEDLPTLSDRFDRIIISGSRTSCLDEAAWIDSLLAFLKMHVNRKTPILGVCFGHQILCRLFGGTKILRVSKTPEYGWIKIDMSASADILKGLPNSFYSLASHQEEVTRLPEEFQLLASSKDCLIQAFQMKEAPVFGVQFHPERTLEAANKSFDAMRKAKKHQLFRNQKKSRSVYNPKIGEKIISNFLNYETS